jgi:acetoin utilization deacetylase AcuC-like enzyme
MKTIPRSLVRSLRRARHRLVGALRKRPVDFVYSTGYPIELPGSLHDPQRGARILGFLDAAGLLRRGMVHGARPVSVRYLRRVHTDEYLDSLNRPESLTRVLGLTVPEAIADKILEAQRTMAGGTLLAARIARDGGGVAVNLGGGLHHAFADKGERFCVYNDVAIAIAGLRARGFDDPILIVDLDLHDGDGVRSLFAADPTVHTFSIHNQSNPQPGEEAVEATILALGSGVGDAQYLGHLREHLPPVFERFQPEMVIYLAGVDVAADDQLGDWKLSEAGILERDRFVMELARDGRERGKKLPVVIALAGGYGLEAWRYSARFLSTLLSGGHAVEPPTTEEAVLAHYRRIAREIEPHELTREAEEDDWGLTDEEVAAMLGGPRRPRRLLGFYTKQGLELAFERTGLSDRLRALGFEDPLVELDFDNPAGDTLRVFGGPDRRELLIEARVRVDRGTLPGMALLRVEWLLLQNPRAEFTPERPPLPGQTHPGLGVLPDVMALLVLACDRLQLDGLLFVPAHYHTACQGRKLLRFVEPEDEARLRAVQQVLDDLPLAEASRAVEEGRIVEADTGDPCRWEPTPMVLPVSERLRERVQSDDYERRVAEALEGRRYGLKR